MRKPGQDFTFRKVLSVLKREFRKWYGIISVEELVGNLALAQEIEILERMFIKEGA